jgi:hypothetical protein
MLRAHWVRGRRSAIRCGPAALQNEPASPKDLLLLCAFALRRHPERTCLWRQGANRCGPAALKKRTRFFFAFLLCCSPSLCLLASSPRRVPKLKSKKETSRTAPLLPIPKLRDSGPRNQRMRRRTTTSDQKQNIRVRHPFQMGDD